MDKTIATFEAQATEVKSRITSSNDREFTIKLVTENPNVLALGAVDAQTTIQVNITMAK